MQNYPQIIVIVGPTAAGKSAAAARLAHSIGGVIINADAQQLYAGLSILTGQDGMGGGELFSRISLNENISNEQYASWAHACIQKVVAAGSVPIIVGGSGFYIDALLYERDRPPSPNAHIRQRVAKLSHEAARAKLCALDSEAAAYVALGNPRRVARALEVVLQTGMPLRTFGQQVTARYNATIVGLYPGAAALRERIAVRVHQMWECGAVEEVRRARADGFTLQDSGLRSIGVREVCDFLDGVMTRSEAIDAHVRATWQYARRQMTWFRKMHGITWYTTQDELWHSLRDFPHKNLPAS